MAGPELTTRSLRSVRWRANAPRIAFYTLVAILSLAGARSILEEPAAAPRVAAPTRGGPDTGANAFAESFARDYLTWDAEDGDDRERRLSGYLAGSLDSSAGLDPADDTSQQVIWTAVVGTRGDSDRRMVTVAAHTSGGPRYLSVPVARNDRGFLYVPSYPAFVGPPATADEAPAEPASPEVDDGRLLAVVERALTNYLARNGNNLLADLTPEAVVSLPPDALHVERVDQVSWLATGRRLAAEVEATDERGSSWTLRYELAVRKRDRWYVRSLQVDPTFKGG